MRRVYIFFFIAFSLIGANRSEKTAKGVKQVYGRERQSFYLKNETPFSFLNTTQKPLKVYLDLAIVMDTTSSIQKNLETFMKKQFYSFLAQLFLRYPLMRVAVVAFRDKNILPFGLRDDYCYKRISPFSSDIGQVAKDFLGLQAGGGGDVDENPLEAILLTVNEKVGLHWRKDKMIRGIPVLNFLLVLTDAMYKTSDYWEKLYKAKRIFRMPNGPNTGAPEDCINREYPSEKMVADALNNYNIFPIFCVPSQKAFPYEKLKGKLHNGRVSVSNMLSRDILSKLITVIDEEIQRRTKITKIPEFTGPISIAPPKPEYIDYVVSKGGKPTDLSDSSKGIKPPSTILTDSKREDAVTTEPVTSNKEVPLKPTTIKDRVPTQIEVAGNVSPQKPSMSKPSSTIIHDVDANKKKETLEPKKNITDRTKEPTSTTLPHLSIENDKIVSGSKPVTDKTKEESIVTHREKDEESKIEETKQGNDTVLLPSTKENKLDSKYPSVKEEEEECSEDEEKEQKTKENKKEPVSLETGKDASLNERESEKSKRRKKISQIIGAAIGGSAVVGIGAWQIAKGIKAHRDRVAKEAAKGENTVTTTSTINPGTGIVTPPTGPTTKPSPIDPISGLPNINVPPLEKPSIPIPGGWGDHTNGLATLPPIHADNSHGSKFAHHAILGASIAAPIVLLASVAGYIVYKKRRNVETLSSMGLNFGEEYGKLLSDEVNVSVQPKDVDFH